MIFSEMMMVSSRHQGAEIQNAVKVCSKESIFHMFCAEQNSLHRKHLPPAATVSSKNKNISFSEQALSAARMDSSLPQSLHTTVKHKCCGLFILFKCRCQPEEQLATRWLQQRIFQGQMNLVILQSVCSSCLKCCMMRCWTRHFLAVRLTSCLQLCN